MWAFSVAVQVFIVYVNYPWSAFVSTLGGPSSLLRPLQSDRSCIPKQTPATTYPSRTHRALLLLDWFPSRLLHFSITAVLRFSTMWNSISSVPVSQMIGPCCTTVFTSILFSHLIVITGTSQRKTEMVRTVKRSFYGNETKR